MNFKWKVIGAVVAIAGAGLTLITNQIDDRKMEETVEKKVREALAEAKEEESE